MNNKLHVTLIKYLIFLSFFSHRFAETISNVDPRSASQQSDFVVAEVIELNKTMIIN
jgi:hypothetical protein